MAGIPTIIKPDEKLLATPGYRQFLDSLNVVYNLREQNPQEVKLVDIDMAAAGLQTPPKVRVNVAEDHPSLSIGLYPKNDGNAVTGSTVYQSPMLLGGVDRWKTASQKLGRYEIKGMIGVPEGHEMSKEPITLAAAIENNPKIKGKIGDTTPVVEVVGLLPFSLDGSYVTEFNPQVWIQPSGHSYYVVGFVMEDKLSYYFHMTEGRSRTDIRYIEENMDMNNWTADRVPDLSAFERISEPTNSGHMILIAYPYEDPNKRFELFLSEHLEQTNGSGIDHSDMFHNDQLMRSPVIQKRVEVTKVRLGKGSRSGSGRLHDGELASTSKGNTTIFHLRYLGIRPEEGLKLDGGKLDMFGSSLSDFRMN